MATRILVTGGEGFIGSHVIDKLVRRGFKTASFDANLNFIDNPKYYKRCLLSRKRLLKQPLKTYKGDIRSIDRIRRVVKDFKPDIIVHLAAIPMARVAEKFITEMIPINLQGSLNVLEVFENSKTEKLIYISSSMAYGHFKQTPQSEDFILEPENLYGVTKAAGEYFVKLSKKDWVIIRATSVYGFTDCANRVTQLLMDAAHFNKTAWVVKGETLDFSYIDDVVAGFIRCILTPQAVGNIINISRGEARAAEEFAKVLKQYFPDFKYEIREPSDHQVWRGPMDITRARTLLKFEPKYSIEDGIRETIKLIKKYNFYNF